MQAGLFLTAEVAECLSLRVSDIIEYSPTKDAFIQAIGVHNVATLKEMGDLHLYDFGIFLQLQPDEEENQALENNIQMALQQQSIELEDAIDLREIKNTKLANQVLKLRRKKKQERDRQQQLENIQAQTESNTQAAQAASQAEIQKNQALNEGKAQIVQLQGQMEVQKAQQDAVLKKELLQMEFEFNMQLKQMEIQAMMGKESQKENRKDDRTRIQADQQRGLVDRRNSQQSELIDQRANQKPPKNFEATSDDTLGGFDLGL